MSKCLKRNFVTSVFCSSLYLSGLKESMRQAELNNWSLDPAQMADLCSSINQFFTATGVIPPQGAAHPQPQAQHPTPPGAPQHPVQPHRAMHPKATQHNQHGQHNQHISTGQFTHIYCKDISCHTYSIRFSSLENSNRAKVSKHFVEIKISILYIILFKIY